ncbi:efflux RND transporter permease subunit [Ampullimonas aquatilis]|uniref:efflux RND transporter permease subunit n=1 Tax=Ampullimonas aquatilis TaxID=1341549 RepID=UPI003C7706EE
MSKFFITRPIFSAVISIIITLIGLVALKVLPVAQYPEIAPPTVLITATYPGASPETLAKTVAAPIEEQLSGVENLIYFSSTSASNGVVTITVTFNVGTNIDLATVNVNNRVQIATPRLPDEVRRNGVTVQKASNDILMAIALQSDDPRYDDLFLSNYATTNILDEMKRLPGVGDAAIFGPRDYGMRIWLKPDRMAQLAVTTPEIVAAINAQNAQFAAGKVGQEPAPSGQALVYTVTTAGRLVEPAQFGEIIVRADAGKGILRLKDVARIELGAQAYDAGVTLNGKPAIAFRVVLQSGANALDVAKNVKDRMAELSQAFPEGVRYVIPFDTTLFVKQSISEVIHTLFEAAILVVLVVFIFLQSWRATLIPMIAVPVSLIGTFGGLFVMGFSINTLTLFAMVLSIGIVVDDAIVVLENVERLMSEEKMSPKDAAIEAMREVSGAIVAIVLVLCAVFVPVAFLGGLAGTLYKQFAVTVAISVVISGIVALTLTPALCALLLKPMPEHSSSRFFEAFNHFFERVTRVYLGGVSMVMKRAVISVLIFLILVGSAVFMLKKIPGSLVPAEDQGYVIAALFLPDAATLQRTAAMGAKVQQLVQDHPAIGNVFVVTGFDLIGGGNKSNAATVFMPLKPFDERTLYADDVIKYVFMKTAGLSDGMTLAFNPPPIRGLGTSGGFEVYVQNRADGDSKRLNEVVQAFMAELKKQPELAGVNTFFRPTVPQLFVDVDKVKALSLGVAIPDIYTTLQSTMGSLYVNDFNKSGRTYRVQLQADQQYRLRPEDLGQMYVKASSGQMIPLKSLITVQPIVGPEQFDRYNSFTAAKLVGNGAPGISSGQTIQVVERVAKASLPPGFTIEWTGQAYQEKRVGSASIVAFSVALILVFLILAAQFERWSLPVAVLLAVPFALFGALTAILLRGMSNDIYFQIGLVTLIGLAAKNAILIVEFAQQKHAEGKSVFDSAKEAARLRFRPIVMTSLAFVLGVVPLAIATGAGASARRSMGTGVVGGMLVATFVATIFVPLFYKLLTREHAVKKEDSATLPAQEGSV